MSKQSICIPDGLQFSDLKLELQSDGFIAFDWQVIERICAASNLPIEMFRDTNEVNVVSLLVSWYRAHRQGGGQLDPVVESLIKEIEIEDAAGQSFSLPAGQA